ncbi:hypothetical protein [Planomonospora sp. ID82291]|uniref:hypothetical protein n=1 Tax=Planomonospora sp. ID82291 TaxID=2738136 RepID=UPI0018C362B8|nr:hypothetical protein [Planomonospora sp. ID82291]MBG0818374.1 hypothetical protein [Planomonospora sp. ID82291]
MRIALRSHHLSAYLLEGDLLPRLLINDLLVVFTDPDGTRYRWPIGHSAGHRPGHEPITYWPAGDVNGAAQRICEQMTRLCLARLNALATGLPPRTRRTLTAAAACTLP